MNDIKEFLKQAARVHPSDKQLRMLNDIEFYAFIHFGPNTYTGNEWGNGAEDPATMFNPYDLDCDSWVEAIKSAGMKGAVITAKHHDGFCLWPSQYTEHSLKNSPYKNGKGDIVRELSDACRRGGIHFGVYISPWDRNSEYYGTDEYNVYYKNQLRELLSNYGEIFYVWFDGACGEGANGKKQVYDFEGYISLINELQPNALIFNDAGPDMRWCGNESGTMRHAEWSVVPHELCHRNKDIQTSGAVLEGDLSFMYNTDDAIGSLPNILYSKGLVYCPSEIDMSIRNGWFYHEAEKPHSLERLFDTYLSSVGNNATFNLNIPPMPSGRFNEADIKRLAELGELIKDSFSTDHALDSDVIVTSEELSETQQLITYKFPECVAVNYIMLMEDIAQGQRVETFCIESKNQFDIFGNNYSGTCVGHKKICRVNLYCDEIRIRVTAARDKVIFKKIALFESE